MLVEEIMTQKVAVCTPSTIIKDCAKLMLDNDCGEIPVVEDSENKILVGVITDRDIACRVVAEGDDPNKVVVENYMTKNITTVKKDDDLDKCYQLMSDNQIRRLPVVDGEMHCIGIVSQAHLARKADTRAAGQLAKDISQPRH